jgi:hypothetical protein
MLASAVCQSTQWFVSDRNREQAHSYIDLHVGPVIFSVNL